MRRKEREIKDFQEKIGILQEGTFLSLALSTNNAPYVVPMNYGYVVDGESLTVYLHNAPLGQKLDMLRENPKVAFTVCSFEKIVEHEKADHWTSHYRSLIATGMASLVHSDDEKVIGLNALMKHCDFKGKAEYPAETLKALVVIKIEVETLTAKQNR